MSSALVISTLVSVALAASPGVPALDAGALTLRLDEPWTPGMPAVALEPARLDLEAAPPAIDLGGVEDHARASSLKAWGRTLRWSTAASLVVTSTLGTFAAINQPTAFGDGRCITGNPILGGDYGCNHGLSTLHGSAAVLSVTLYTANAVLGLAAPISRGTVPEAARPVYRVLTWVHLGGIIVQPALGLIAAYPQVIGKSNTAPTDSLPRNLRTVHVFIGWITTAAFLTTTILEN
jgi:hypothetical protein